MDDTQSDNEQAPMLLREWTAKDFSNLYLRYHPRVVKHAQKYLINRSQAEEVAQEAFFYLMTSLPEVDSEVGVLRLLKWKTKMLCLDLIRLESRRSYAPLEIAESDLVVNEPSDSIIRADETAIVTLALAQLSPNQRQALVSSVYQERSNKEIAAELGVSENAAKQLIYRAKSSFRRALIGEAKTNGLTMSEILSIAARKAARDAGKNAKYIATIAAAVVGISLWPVSLGDNDQNEEVAQTSPANSSIISPEQPVQEAENEPSSTTDEPLGLGDFSSDNVDGIADSSEEDGFQALGVIVNQVDSQPVTASLDLNSPTGASSQTTTEKEEQQLMALATGLQSSSMQLRQVVHPFGTPEGQFSVQFDFDDQMSLVLNYNPLTRETSAPVLTVTVNDRQLVGIPKLTSSHATQLDEDSFQLELSLQDFHSIENGVLLERSWISDSASRVELTAASSGHRVIDGRAIFGG